MATLVRRLEAFSNEMNTLIKSRELTKSRLQPQRAPVVNHSQTELGLGWFEETYTKLLKGVNEGILAPDVLMQVHAQPVWALQDLSKSMRDHLDLPSAQEAQFAMVKSLQAGHDGR